jgi:hypothetical protein
LSLVVALAASGCTLTSDPFDPGLVDPDGQSTLGARPLVSPDESPDQTPDSTLGDGDPGDGDPTGTFDPGEGEDPPVRLDPPGTGDGELGNTGQETLDPEPNGVADAGSSSAPDAGPPPVVVVPCEGSEFGGSCYEFVAQLVAWDAAEAACVAWGGHLASVGSPGEDAFLGGWPAELGLPPGNGAGIWLGGTDAEQDNIFQWSDGSPFLLNGWAQNQPDDGAGVDCVTKRNDFTTRWYDQRCTDLHPYVCEKPL